MEEKHISNEDLALDNSNGIVAVCNFCDQNVKGGSYLVLKCARHMICGNCLTTSNPSSVIDEDCHLCPKLLFPDTQLCDKCYTNLEIGVAHFRPWCTKHVYCASCFFGDGLKTDECIQCGHEVLKTCDLKNSMPLLPIVNGIFTTADQKLKYSYPSQFIEKNIRDISCEYETIEVPPDVSYWRFCKTAEPDTVLALGENSPKISVLTKSGVHATHKLISGDMIASAIPILNNIFLLLVGYSDDDGFDNYGERSKYKLQLVRINIDSSNNTTLIPDYSIDVQHEPIHLFNICKQRYGLLCVCEYRNEKGQSFSRNVMHIYTLDRLLLMVDLTVAGAGLQTDVVWGRRVIPLESSTGDNEKYMCVSPNKYFYLAQSLGINIYSPSGMYVCTVGAGKNLDCGYVKSPVSLICQENGDILAVERVNRIVAFTFDSFAKCINFAKKSVSSEEEYLTEIQIDEQSNMTELPPAYSPGKWFDWWQIVRGKPKTNNYSLLAPLIRHTVVTNSYLWCVEEVFDANGVYRALRVYEHHSNK